MNPIFYTSSSNTYSPYPNDHYEDHLNTHQFLNPNSQASSSSKSLTTHLFLSSNDQNGVFNSEFQFPQYQNEGDNFGSQAYNNHGIENNNLKGVELSTWNKSGVNNMNNDLHQVKWMSSKMRVMLKMKKSDHPINLNTYSTSTSRDVTKLEEHKLPSDNSSNSTSSNNNLPIRVCSDCNTTKTPLWRSGPRGPKSLCNACGIRQRKARRAMAAAAENGNSCGLKDQSVTPLKVIKTQHKDIKKPSKGHVTKYKKRQYTKQITTTPPSPSPSPSPSPPSSSPARKNCVEDFLASLSKNLTFYHVMPQDEKEAAILLMALSCGYAHET
ncbi:hypothetical protein L1987_14130 [Smallanthus sonchifolius]|uniref:Uncharacterized protein n=1 Tax=Smallanthus sonchifolius TaxID=185202 RepID=A0ACB9J4J0_9ASTR|nr:hypothetical protein L1987_14130 [Smallanthus sonchifolius]